jgi:predicted anti-sigma-YlaC factor YlaD
LISASVDRPLSPLDRAGLLLHLLICSACRAYRQSLHMLTQLMQSAADTPPACGDPALPDAARERILRKLNEP